MELRKKWRVRGGRLKLTPTKRPTAVQTYPSRAARKVGSMQFRTIVSAFYLDAKTTVPDLGVMVRRAGVRDFRPLRDSDRVALGFLVPEREVLGGTWDVFQETWAVLDVVEGFRLPATVFTLVRFLDASHQDRENDPEGQNATLAFVRTFGDACVSLYPTAALLDTRAHYEDQQWEDQEGKP